MTKSIIEMLGETINLADHIEQKALIEEADYDELAGWASQISTALTELRERLKSDEHYQEVKDEFYARLAKKHSNEDKT